MNMFVLPVSLYILHARGYTIINFQFAGREMGIVGSAVVEVLQPLSVYYCLFVTLLISMSFIK